MGSPPIILNIFIFSHLYYLYLLYYLIFYINLYTLDSSPLVPRISVLHPLLAPTLHVWHCSGGRPRGLLPRDLFTLFTFLHFITHLYTFIMVTIHFIIHSVLYFPLQSFNLYLYILKFFPLNGLYRGSQFTTLFSTFHFEKLTNFYSRLSKSTI